MRKPIFEGAMLTHVPCVVAAGGGEARSAAQALRPPPRQTKLLSPGEVFALLAVSHQRSSSWLFYEMFYIILTLIQISQNPKWLWFLINNFKSLSHKKLLIMTDQQLFSVLRGVSSSIPVSLKLLFNVEGDKK